VRAVELSWNLQVWSCKPDPLGAITFATGRGCVCERLSPARSATNTSEQAASTLVKEAYCWTRRGGLK
jgi:hypothetical protein